MPTAQHGYHFFAWRFPSKRYWHLGLCFKATNRGRGSQQNPPLQQVESREAPISRHFIFIRLLIQLGENLPHVDAVVIIDKNPGLFGRQRERERT